MIQESVDLDSQEIFDFKNLYILTICKPKVKP
jgi:hypothetical protein